MRLSQLECLARSKLSEQKLRDRSLSLGLRRISWGRAWLLAVCCVALVLNLGATGVLAARAPAVLTACSFKALTSAVPRVVGSSCSAATGRSASLPRSICPRASRSRSTARAMPSPSTGCRRHSCSTLREGVGCNLRIWRLSRGDAHLPGSSGWPARSPCCLSAGCSTCSGSGPRPTRRTLRSPCSATGWPF